MGNYDLVDNPEHDISEQIMLMASIEALQSSEQRELMDLVDRLRRAGLNTFLQPPQIIVCRDQSSGKSSILEEITETPFPRKENLCTRFATEIRLRRDTEQSISYMINTDEECNEEEIDSYEFCKPKQPRCCGNVVSKASHYYTKILLILTVYWKHCKNVRNAEA